MHIYFIFYMAYLRSGGRLFDKVLLDAVENCAANFLASLFDISSFLSSQICSYFCEATTREGKTEKIVPEGREGREQLGISDAEIQVFLLKCFPIR